MATTTLDALKGILMNACGDLVTASQQVEGVARLQVKVSHSEQFKAAVRGYVSSYSKEHSVHITVSFPKPFEIRLRERRKTARSTP